MRTLPKPPRVEKWQKWRDTSDGKNLELVMMEHSAGGTWFATRDGQCGWYGMGMLEAPEWTFLGYAKPDKVEVGQRWRSKTCVYDVRRKMAHPRRDDVWELFGEDRVAMDSTETEIRGWEYLGMAESADAKKEAPRFEPVALAGEQWRLEGPVMDPRINWAVAQMWPTRTVPCDYQTEARRANEEAAKRLIANPPEWAYQKAWRCAVLALQERANVDDHRIFPASGDNICAEMLLEECKRAHNRQPRISGVVYDPIRDVLFDAYARGMERPYPLMGRPGVKGGVSTCDLGADYE